MLCTSQPIFLTHRGCHPTIIKSVPRPPHQVIMRGGGAALCASLLSASQSASKTCCAAHTPSVPQPTVKLLFQPQLQLRALAAKVQRVGKDRQQLQQPAVQGKGPQLHRVTAVQQQIIGRELASHQRKECKTPLLNVGIESLQVQSTAEHDCRPNLCEHGVLVRV